MKNRTDKILSLLFAVSVIGYFLLFFVLQDVSFPPREFVFLWYAAPVIPAFCFQFLLCRNIKRKWAAALPAVLLISWCLLVLSIAPAAGCALAWAVYGLHRLYKRGDIRG